MVETHVTRTFLILRNNPIATAIEELFEMKAEDEL